MKRGFVWVERKDILSGPAEIFEYYQAKSPFPRGHLAVSPLCEHVGKMAAMLLGEGRATAAVAQ